MKKQLPVIASICTGVLLFLSFPPLGFSFCGWMALIPLMFASAMIALVYKGNFLTGYNTGWKKICWVLLVINLFFFCTYSKYDSE